MNKSKKHCPHNHHCHRCMSAPLWDFYFFIFALALTAFMIYFSGWGVLKYLIWPWVFLLVISLLKYLITRKSKPKSKQK